MSSLIPNIRLFQYGRQSRPLKVEHHSVRKAKNLLLVAIATGLGIASASPSNAVILSVGDGNGNSNADVVTATRNIGPLNGASGTYIGDSWVLTANHVGPGDIVIEDVAYSHLPGTAIRLETTPGQYADLFGNR